MPKVNYWPMNKSVIFLNALASTGNVSAAARAARLTRKQVYERRRADEEFRTAWNMALDEALDDLEFELRRRALEGTEKPIFYGGEEVGKTRAFNDNLGMFILKSRRRDIFGDKNITGPSDGVDGEKNVGTIQSEDICEMLAERLERIALQSRSSKNNKAN